MDILVKNMELTQLLDIFNEAGVRFYKNGEPIEFEIFHNDVGPIKHGQMSDYIKREDAIKEANTWSMFGNDNLESRLKRLPSADVVEVIRCENCEFWDKDENILGGICDEWSDFEDSIISYTKPDDYCSKGERKEEENE